MQGKKSHQEKLFIQFQLSDYVPADNFYRQLKKILDLQFLYQSTAGYYGKEGQKSIDPVVFMKLMLIDVFQIAYFVFIVVVAAASFPYSAGSCFLQTRSLV
jgi:hypothetical protein